MIYKVTFKSKEYENKVLMVTAESEHEAELTAMKKCDNYCRLHHRCKAFERYVGMVVEANRVSDPLFNAVSHYTRKSKLDSVFDIVSGEVEDYFYDYENESRMSLEEGFSLLNEAAVFPLTDVGISETDEALIAAALQEYAA